MHARHSTLTALFTLIISVVPCAAQQVFDARGFHPQRAFPSQLPFEHVDPMTGNLLLTFTDLVLPGNAGFDLRIQRTYNSKIYRNYATSGDLLAEDSWAGIGWTLHLGRVFHGLASDGADPIIELPDGSRHHAYPHVQPPSGCSPCFITRDYWIYSKGDTSLTLPNGTRYVFGHSGNTGSPDGAALYATAITDTFGNSVTVAYMTGASAPPDGIATITQDLGTQTRQVTFQSAGSTTRSLSSMSFLGRVWSYTQTSTVEVSQTLLTRVSPPAGGDWVFSYSTATSPKFEIASLLTPNGGTIAYQFGDKTFNIGSTIPVLTRVLTTRTTGGRDIAPGAWSYSYAQGPGANRTVITAPCNSETYEFQGIGNFTFTGSAWTVGLPVSRTLTAAGTTLETEDWTWQPSAAISLNEEIIGLNHDPDIFVPLLNVHSLSRGSVTLTADHNYGSASFNDYGRPNQTIETGNRGQARTISRTFTYAFNSYIVDKMASETTTSGSESFTTTFSYAPATGFLLSQSVYGVTTSFGATSAGNVASRTDANNHTITFTYSWGRQANVLTPEYTITRQINQDGTVLSETRRGFTTALQYDALSRPTQIDPPAGSTTTIAYDAAGTFVRTTRGSSISTGLLDGFGRSAGSSNAVGVQTDRTYDACGRVTYESYPFTTSNIGTTIQYDGLGRATRRTNPDPSSSFATFSYSGLDVTMTDEEGRTTSQEYSGFADPVDARLTAFVDGNGQRTTYAYNAAGSLTRVTPPVPFSSRIREWTYNSKNRLVAEMHPESGTATSVYDLAGNLTSRTDARNQTTTFTYDDNDRLTIVNRPSSPSDPGGTLSDVHIGYDASDNRTSLTSGTVSTTFAYDAANRLTSRTDAVNGHSFVTGFGYDGNDNVTSIDYPSGNRVTYTYDAANRITSVRDAASNPFATSFNYHPSGAVSSFTAGNGIVHSASYDTRYRPTALSAGALQLTYGYDRVGNVTSGNQPNRSGFSQGFDYDNLDRLVTVSGFGANTFTYDALGNRLSKSSLPVTYSYDGSSRLTSSTGSEAGIFQYDANGNLTGDTAGSFSYEYAPTNLLQKATVGGHLASYRYDGDDQRTFKTVDGVSTYSLHSLGNSLLSEYEQTATKPFGWIRDYVYAGSRLLASTSCRFSLSPTSTALTAAAASGSTALTASPGCSWTAASDSSFVTVTSAANGTGTATVSYAVGANPGGTSRTATLTVAGLAFTVTQAGANCTFSLSPTSASLGSAGGSGSVGVTSPSGCPWTATSNAGWITVTGGTPGSGNGSVSYSVGANGSSGARAGTITIGGQIFTVNQSGTACSFGISPSSATLPGTGGSGSVSVSAAPSDCAWSSSSQASWITVTAGGAGTGPGTLQYSATSNPSTSPRSGTIVIAGQTFTLTENGATSVPLMNVDTPANNATAGPPFSIAGWAIDLADPSGPGVNTVHVWAYPASGPSPVFMGAATYGGERPDIAAAYGERFRYSGFGLTTTGLPAGQCQFVVSAFSTVAGGFNNAQVVTVNIPAPNPQVAIDVPGNGTTVTSPFPIGGWAVDLAASTGTGIDTLHVWAYPVSGDPIFLGAVTYGGSRPDVGAYFGNSRFTPSGFGLTVSSLSPGTYTLAIFPHSLVSGAFTAAVTVVVTVQ